MNKFKVGDTVKWQGDDGVLCGIIINLERSCAVTHNMDIGICEVETSRLCYIPQIKLGADDFAALIRLEGDLSALVENDARNIENIDGYLFSVSDLLSALNKIKAGGIDKAAYLVWYELVSGVIYNDLETEEGELYCDADALDLMHTELPVTLDEDSGEYIDRAISIGEHFIEDRERPLLDRRYPDDIKRRLLVQMDNDDLMAMADEETVILYRRFAEELAPSGDRFALRAVAYGCYGGNRAFDCDWERSRDCLIRLFEDGEDDEKREFYANTLGYIYYYGRCEGGVPDYENAYKYFSYAALSGVYEAKYKLADMYRNGYGVVKSRALAGSLIRELYRENLKYIYDGVFESKLADIALRMGNISLDWEDEEDKSYEAALYYYTQADYAIRMRMMECDYYGDEKVARAIAKALEDTRSAIGEWRKDSVHYCSLEWLLGDVLEGCKRLDLVIKKYKNGDYSFTFSPRRRRNKPFANKMLITVPALDMCGLYDSITLRYKTDTPIDEELIGRVISVDGLDYSGLYFDGERIASLCGSFILKDQGRKDEKKYRVATVCLGPSAKYDYCLGSEDISVGDRVVISLLGKEYETTVLKITERRASELVLPLKAYTSILRRV
ncbi:MAG: sel1 repeat family protein [Clostridia bacterium]|nr:sel1 repeat family protein [Clostridia bacterium]